MSRICVALLLLFISACTTGKAARWPTTGARFVGGGAAGPLAQRLIVELDAVQIGAILLEGFDLPDPELARLARLHGVRAGILLQRLPGRARRLQIFVVEASGLVARQKIVQGAAESAAEVVLRAVETLRAELLPLPEMPRSAKASAKGKGPPSSRATSQSMPSTSAPSSSRPVDKARFVRARSQGKEQQLAVAKSPVTHRRAFALGLFGGLSFGPGGVDPLPRLGLSFGWRFTTHWALRFYGRLPLSSATVEDQNGRSEIYLASTSVALQWLPLDARSRFRLHLGIGAGAGLLYALGKATPPFTSQNDTGWAALLSADVGLSYLLGARWAVRLDASSTLWIPRPQVAIGDDVAADVGRPLLHAALGVEVAL